MSGLLGTYLLTPWSTILLEKLTGFAANQEIPRILWNPEVHYRTHKRPPIRYIRKISKSDCYLRHVCLSVRPSVRLKQLGSTWTDFHEIQEFF
jgi:hypothetical protein